MKDYENCKRIVREFTEGVNNGDRKALDRTLIKDYVSHTFLDTFYGREAFYDGLDELRKAFPDMKVHIDEQVADDDHVVNRVHMTGTHDGEFAGIPATHKKVETTGMAMFKFEGDKISEHWAEWNILGILAQVGAKPMRPQDC